MRKLTSFKELAEERNVIITPMDSSDVRRFNDYMKRSVRESSRNSLKASISASKVCLTR